MVDSYSQFQSDLRSPSVKFRRGLISSLVRVSGLILLDSLLLSCAWKLAIATSKVQLDSVTQDSSILLIVAIFAAISTVGNLYRAGDFRRDYWAIIKAVSITTTVLLLVSLLNEPLASQVTFLFFWLFSIPLISIGRYGFNRVIETVRTKGEIRYRVFLITDPTEEGKNTQLLKEQNYYNLVGVTRSSALDRANRDTTFAMLEQQNVTEVFVSWSAIKNRPHLCWRFQSMGIQLRILSIEPDLLFSRAETFLIGRMPAWTLQLPTIVGSEYLVKRCLDSAMAAVAIVLLFPVYLIIGLLIKIDSPGPIFFRQVRIGLLGQKFKVWKFRTMVQNAHELQAALEARNEIKDGVLFKMKDDPRITRVGKFLRQYSLDELPQLFNVLVGEMSFVGPRPLPVRDVEKFKESHFIRQEVMPGITGLWQVSGRSDIDRFDEAVKLDLEYIANWSLHLDLKILLKTIQVVLSKSGAY